MSLRLEKKTCLITGASRGIGAGTALYLAQQGMDIAFTYKKSQDKALTLKNKINAMERRCLAFQADSTDYTKANQIIEHIIKTWERLDVLVNNSGVTQDNILLRMTEKQWDDTLEINLKSVFNYSKAAVKWMVRSRKGIIINISSIIGLTGNAGQSNYAASKAGIIGFSKSLAKELASRNIRVNVIAPGYIATDMTNNMNEEQRRTLVKAIPLKRVGKIEDIAAGVAFLSSDMSNYITGTILTIDGGMAMRMI